MRMIRTRCPYCGNYDDNNFVFKKSSSQRDVVCSKCSLKYQVSFYVQDNVYTYDDELKKVLPQDKIDTIKKVISKYLNYQGKGGYESSQTITLDKEFEERISSHDKALIISFSGKSHYYKNEYRTVRFYITYDSVSPEVTSQYTWRQKYWFRGNTLEEQVDNYIKEALVKWETI